jgi:heptaprenyl diphosphate synthase
MSASGAVAALAVLGLQRLVASGHMGAIGYSVAAALAHMGAQIAVARWLFIPHPAILALAPFLLTAALVFGIVSGVIAATVLALLARPAQAATR